MIPGFILTAWASKVGRPLMIVGGVILLGLLIFGLGRCSKDDYEDDYRAQIDQTTRSGDAAADAAETAVEILDGRTATEDAIDQVVEEAVKEIDAAANPDAVRTAVLAAVCNTPEHRNDPACVPKAENRQ